MHALCQISLAVCCLLYEVRASEKPVQEILFYYLYMLWNVRLEIFCLVFFEIILHHCLSEFHRRIKFVDEKVWIKKKKVDMNLMFKEHPMYVSSIVNWFPLYSMNN